MRIKPILIGVLCIFGATVSMAFEPEYVDEDEYYGPDLSDERSLEDDLLVREIPLPRAPHPEPPKRPPTPEQYAPPRTYSDRGQ